ncbi:MAG: hypothetical protein RBT67_07715 [Thauera sp.]|nr:hypothetical protein [Thauera sp.]
MQCPKCGYVRQESDAAPDYECPRCGIVYAKFNKSLSPEEQRKNALQAGASKQSAVAPCDEIPPMWLKRDPDERQPKAVPPASPLDVLLAPAMLIGGSVAPLLSVPMVGTISATRLQFSDGYILIALAVISILLAHAGRAKALVYTGAIAFLITMIDFVMIFQRVAEAKETLTSDLKGNPFAGLAIAAANSVSLEWGWVLLFAGSVGILAYGMGFRIANLGAPRG